MTSGLVVTFSEKLYVGIQGRKNFSTIDYPLGFATPYATDSAGKKRQETVDNWVGQGNYNYQTGTYDKPNDDYESKIIDNVPIEGFQLEKVVSRWQTSNKMYRINDPRGFTVEIDTANLCDILLNCVVDHGRLLGKFIWGRADGKNYLTRLDHPSYQESLEEKVNRTTLRPGDVLRLGVEKLKYTYVGTFYLLGLESELVYTRKSDDAVTPDYVPDRNYYYNREETHEQKYFSRYVRDVKPMMIFERLEQNSRTMYKAMRKPSKIEIIAENQPFTPLEQKFQHFDGESTGWLNVYMPFESKQELLAFIPDHANTRRIRLEGLPVDYGKYSVPVGHFVSFDKNDYRLYSPPEI